jgi:hypothetical protein
LGPLTPEGLAKPSASEHGYAPRVISTPAGVFGSGRDTQGRPTGARTRAWTDARVQQLTAAFGGVQYLTDAAREFIETWEVEAYRASS